MGDEQQNESRMVDLGRAKVEAAIARAAEKQHEHTAQPWKGMVPALITRSIHHLAKQVSKRGRTRPNGASEVMDAKLKPEVVFLIGATAVVEGICRQERIQWVVRRIAKFLEAEVKMKEFAREERKQFKRLEQKAAERASTNLSKRMATYTKAARRATYDSHWIDWTYEQQVNVGNLIVGCMIRGGLIEMSHLGSGRKRQNFLVLTPAGQELLDGRLDFALDMARPTFRPMIEAPLDWTPEVDGGYAEMHYDVALVKSHRPQDQERFRVADMPRVYAGINTIQATTWRINEDLLVVAEELLAAGGGRAGLPASHASAMPVKPEGLWPDGPRAEMEEEPRAHLDSWLRVAREAHNAEAARSSKFTQAGQILQVADDYKGDASIYFPHSLDWRGRCYPIPSQLNPQGTDLAKGLLMFAEGRELGEHGAYWLAVHGANCWGEDKAPLNDRVDWVLDGDPGLIARVAADPLTNREWEEADAPFQFLAFCIEWSAYLEDGESNDFLSYLPVAMDGSCNGLQHFSAMLRDPVGAAATNLVACEKPNDIYTQVAEQVSERVALVAVSDEPEARVAHAWMVFGISRSIVKRQVMTTPYGVTSHGGLDQLLEEMQKQGAQDQFEDLWQACKWISPIIFEVIGEVVLAARQAQDFLTELARVLAANDTPIGWTAPSGFPVLQEYKKAGQFRVKSLMVGNTSIRYRTDTPDLDRVGQARGVSPNFVHSYDAAHLALTVVEAEREAGRRLSWAAVHDSFGTHAGDVELMQRVLREQFLAMYQDRNPLADLREQAAMRLPEGTELPEVPEIGSFDLAAVLKATFFFA